MAKDRIERLYADMSLEDRAALFFSCAARRDSEEMEKVWLSVPRRTYSMRHVVYQDRIQRICDVASVFAIEFWKLIASLYKPRWVAEGMQGREPQSDSSMEILSALWNRDCIVRRDIAALVAALQEIAVKYGFEAKSVHVLADATSTFAEIHVERIAPDAVAQQKYCSLFESVLSPHEVGSETKPVARSS